MKHYIYKTTNLITGTYYIGCHSTESLNNDYLGSGYLLESSIKKYGRKNFKKEIWFLCRDIKSKLYLESVIVNRELLKDPNCMNLVPGGIGKKTIGSHGWSIHWKRFNHDLEYRDSISKKLSKATRKRMEENVKNGTHPWLNHKGENWIGRKHKPETIKKIRNSTKGKHIGKNNSQFGTMWITNGKESCKIKKDQPTPNGWRYGRTL